MFSSLAGLKCGISFLLGLPLSTDITDAVIAFSGETFCVILVLMAFVSNGVKKSMEHFTSLGGIYRYHSSFLYPDFSEGL